MVLLLFCVKFSIASLINFETITKAFLDTRCLIYLTHQNVCLGFFLNHSITWISFSEFINKTSQLCIKFLLQPCILQLLLIKFINQHFVIVLLFFNQLVFLFDSFLFPFKLSFSKVDFIYRFCKILLELFREIFTLLVKFFQLSQILNFSFQDILDLFVTFLELLSHLFAFIHLS